MIKKMKILLSLKNRATLSKERGMLQGCGVHGYVLEISWHDATRNVPRWSNELVATPD